MINTIVNISDIKEIKPNLKQILNLYNDIKDLNIEVVANKSAVKAFLKDYGDNEIKEEIQNLVNKHVKFNVCLNTLNALNIPEEQIDFERGFGKVNSGVGEIVRRQSEGYAYLKL